jgi:hypothetical protein
MSPEVAQCFVEAGKLDSLKRRLKVDSSRFQPRTAPTEMLPLAEMPAPVIPAAGGLA